MERRDRTRHVDGAAGKSGVFKGLPCGASGAAFAQDQRSRDRDAGDSFLGSVKVIRRCARSSPALLRGDHDHKSAHARFEQQVFAIAYLAEAYAAVIE